MPTYAYKDEQSGVTMQFEGDAPPDLDVLELAFKPHREKKLAELKTPNDLRLAAESGLIPKEAAIQGMEQIKRQALSEQPTAADQATALAAGVGKSATGLGTGLATAGALEAPILTASAATGALFPVTHAVLSGAAFLAGSMGAEGILGKLQEKTKAGQAISEAERKAPVAAQIGQDIPLAVGAGLKPQEIIKAIRKDPAQTGAVLGKQAVGAAVGGTTMVGLNAAIQELTTGKHDPVTVHTFFENFANALLLPSGEGKQPSKAERPPILPAVKVGEDVFANPALVSHDMIESKLKLAEGQEPERGFVESANPTKFLTREEAAKIAKEKHGVEANQEEGKLHSDDLIRAGLLNPDYLPESLLKKIKYQPIGKNEGDVIHDGKRVFGVKFLTEDEHNYQMEKLRAAGLPTLSWSGVNGYWKGDEKGSGTIFLKERKSESDPIFTHEIVHGLRETGLISKEQWEKLVDADTGYKNGYGKRTRDSILPLYADQVITKGYKPEMEKMSGEQLRKLEEAGEIEINHDKLDEEVIAHVLQDWHEHGLPKEMKKTWFETVRDFVKGLWSKQDVGSKTGKQVMQDVLGGRLEGAGDVMSDGGIKYAVVKKGSFYDGKYFGDVMNEVAAEPPKNPAINPDNWKAARGSLKDLIEVKRSFPARGYQINFANPDPASAKSSGLREDNLMGRVLHAIANKNTTNGARSIINPNKVLLAANVEHTIRNADFVLEMPRDTHSSHKMTGFVKLYDVGGKKVWHLVEAEGTGKNINFNSQYSWPAGEKMENGRILRSSVLQVGQRLSGQLVSEVHPQAEAPVPPNSSLTPSPADTGKVLETHTDVKPDGRDIEKVFKAVKDNPYGFTIDPFTGESKLSGYAVAPSKLTQVEIKPEEFTPDKLDDYLERFKNVFELHRGRANLGGWIDSETGKINLDVSYVIDNLHDALHIARNGNQKAIWHLDGKAGEQEIQTENGIEKLKSSGSWNDEKGRELAAIQGAVETAIRGEGSVPRFSKREEPDFSDLQWWKRDESGRGRAEAASGEPAEAGKPRKLIAGEKPDGYVPLRHWSAIRRKEINPKFQGTGYAGAEADRLEAYPDIYPQRSYFGLNGYRKESGLGNVVHNVEVKADRLYDFDADPLNLAEKAIAIGRKSGKFASAEWAAFDTIHEKLIKDAGFGGYFSRAHKIAALFKPVKEGRNPMFSKSEQPLWSDNITDALTELKQEKFSPEQLKSHLAKYRGTKDQADWIGLDEFLDGKKSVTKQEVVDFVKAKPVELRDKVLGAGTSEGWSTKRNDEESDHAGREIVDVIRPNGNVAFTGTPSEANNYLWEEQQMGRAGSPTKYESYQTEGGENYRELLVTMPDGRVSYYDLMKSGMSREEAQKASVEQSKPSFKSGHFDEPNILGHIRFNERESTTAENPTPVPTLHLEEIQSDWHQKGRKQGYIDSAAVKSARKLWIDTTKELNELYVKQAGISHADLDSMPLNAAHNKARKVFREYSKMPEGSARQKFGIEMLSKEAELWDKAIEYEQQYMEIKTSGGVPDAPFKNTWPMLMFKRALAWAIDHDFKRITWTTGEQQNTRYDLSKQVESVSYKRNKDGTYELSALKEGRDYPIKSNAKESELEDLIGKELAKKAVAGEGEPDKGDAAALGWKTFAGENLKVGGKGMRKFYDEMLPNEVNKFVKKMGGKVGEAEIKTGEYPSVFRYDTTGVPRQKPRLWLEKKLEEIRDKWNMPNRTAEGWQFWNVTLDNQADKVLREMIIGESLEDAISHYGSKELAEKLGIDGVWTKPEIKKEKVHSLDITPQMVESRSKGMPMFSKVDETTGIRRETVEREISQGKLDWFPRGVGAGTDSLLRDARKRLIAGENFNDAILRFRQSGSVNEKDISLLRAAAEVFGKVSDDAYRKFGTGSSEHNKAQADYQKIQEIIGEMKTVWHKTGQAAQGEADVNLASPTVLAFERKKNQGRDLTPAEEVQAKQLAEKVEASDSEVEKAEKKVIATEAGEPEPKIPTEVQRIAKEILSKMSKIKDDSMAEIRKLRESAEFMFSKIAGEEQKPEQPKRIPDEHIGKFANVGAVEILNGFGERSAWDAKMLENLGERSKPHLDQIWEASQLRKAEIEKELVGKVRPEVREQVRKKVTKAPAAPKDYKAEALKQLALPKVDGKRSPKAVKAVWEYVKDTYSRKGMDSFSEIKAKVAADLGISSDEVGRILAQNQNIKRVTDEMYQQMANNRRIKMEAKRWAAHVDEAAWKKFVKSIPARMFAAKVGFHGTVALGTHAPVLAFQPAFWRDYARNFFKMYQMVGSPKYYEMQVQDLVHRPNYDLASRAGLVVDPSKLEDYNNPAVAQYFKGISGMGNRGYFVLKVLRQDIFDHYWDRLPESLKGEKGSKEQLAMAAAIADAANHITGVVKKGSSSSVPSLLLFAPKLMMSRVAWLAGDPYRALETFTKWNKATEAEKMFARAQVSEKLWIAGTLMGLLAANQGLLMAFGSNQTINVTNPMESDYLKFKVAGTQLAYGSAMLGMARLPLRIFLDIKNEGKANKFVLEDERVATTLMQYARSQASPFAGTMADLAIGRDFQERPLPRAGFGTIEGKTSVPKRLRMHGITTPYTWPEYAGVVALPIPFQEAWKEVWRSGLGMSEEQMRAYGVALIETMFNAGTGGRMTKDIESMH